MWGGGSILSRARIKMMNINWPNFVQTFSSFSSVSKTVVVLFVEEEVKENKEVLPDSVMQFLPYLIKDNWLLNYTNFEGIEKTLIGMNKRTHKQSQMHLAIADLKLHYTDFESDFTDFFENLRTFSANKILEIP